MRRLLVALVASAALVGVGAGVAFRSSWLDGSGGGPALSRDDVRQAQHHLKAKGLYDGRIDGVIGPQTREALRRYQQDNGLAETARLDAPTADRLTGGPVPSAPADAGSSGVPRGVAPGGDDRPTARAPR
jgi:peptidoglycan hydrolase-like protein with peptidoglycan-binding domain